MPRPTPDIVIRLTGGKRDYAPGEHLSAELSVKNWEEVHCRWAEASVVWYTVGKGDEDLHVHYFKRLHTTGDAAVDLSQPYAIETTLPASPLSYDGLIVKVCWAVRLRLFEAGLRESSGETPLRLGNVAAPKLPGERTVQPN